MKVGKASTASLLVALTLLTSACRVGGLVFRADDRIEVVSPKPLSTVSLPVVLKWVVKDFEITGADGTARPDAGYFAVLIDRSPMPAGEGLRYFGRDDRLCELNPRCPTQRYLEDRDIYLTQNTSFRIAALPDRRRSSRAKDQHEATIVLLNGKSERVGETYFTTEFNVKRSPKAMP